MDTADQLARTVCENPGDATAWHVLADWLAEHGDVEHATLAYYMARSDEMRKRFVEARSTLGDTRTTWPAVQTVFAMLFGKTHVSGGVTVFRDIADTKDVIVIAAEKS